MGTLSERGNLTVVQALRGIAAIWVVLFHASEGGHLRGLENIIPTSIYDIIFNDGHYGVAIFFALSGFVISYGLSGNNINLPFFKVFIARRIIRLNPPYWASIVLSVIFLLISAHIRHESVNALTPTNIILHLFYLQVIFNQPDINTVYWTLTYEIQFYIFLVGVLTLSIPKTTTIAGFSVSTPTLLFFLLAIFAALGTFNGLRFGIFLGMWPCFYVGVLAHKAKYSQTYKLLLLLLATAMSANGVFFIISSITALFLWISLAKGWAYTGMRQDWLQFLGKISYSLYLIHNPISGATGFIIRKILGNSILTSFVSLVGILVASIISAYIFWFCIEKQTHRWAKNVGRARCT